MNTKEVEKIEIPETFPEPLLKDFEKNIRSAITKAYQEEQNVSHIRVLATELETLTQQAIEIGDLAYQHLQSNSANRINDYLITFDWGERVKSFFILWRDIIFQEHKIFLQVSDGMAKLKDFDAIKKASRDVLFSASNDITDYLVLTKKVTPNLNQLQEAWSLQANPWPIYKEQLQELGQQAIKLYEQFDILWNSSGAYILINSQFMDIFNEYLDTLGEASFDLNELIKETQDLKEEDSKGFIVSRLEEIDNKVLSSIKPDGFNAQLRENLQTLPDAMHLYVNSTGGGMLYKDINIRQSTSEWIESEVMSEIYEFFQVSDANHSRLNLAIENIKNRIQSDTTEDNSSIQQDILQTLNNLKKNLSKSGERVINLRAQAEDELKNPLGVSRVFEDDFLELSFQSTINQYRRFQVEWWEKLKKWVAQKGYFIKEYRRSLQTEEAKSTSEKIVRVVHNRTLKSDNIHYSNIFMTRGYIGSSFWVGRERELEHVEEQFENWKLGFRGALLFSGKRFSGKTLMGHLVNQKFFDDQAIILRPDNRIEVQGRSFETHSDLGATLKFILKYKKEEAMIWIDDLELWQDDKIPLSQNVEKLIATIDQYSNKIFFMVSMSNWLKDQLEKWFDIEKIFQSELNLDKMRRSAVQKAVLLRHSATHIQLVNKTGEEFKPKELENIIARLYRASEGNIGEVLHRWAVIMEKYNSDKVYPRIDDIYQLPNFLNPDVALLLRTIIFKRRTNEYRLRKTLGPAFKSVYRPILQRALHLGIVERNINGWLEINPMIVNEVGRMLDDKQYIEFDGKISYSPTAII